MAARLAGRVGGVRLSGQSAARFFAVAAAGVLSGLLALAMRGQVSILAELARKKANCAPAGPARF
jgi:hypothetical protein